MKAILLLLACLAPAQAAGVRLWAVGDGVRVNPVTGKLIEARPDIHPDYPVADPRAGNRAWDSARRTVRLSSARNEFTAFQLIVESDGPQQEVNVTATALRHASGARIEGRNVALFKEWYVQVRGPSTGYEKLSLGPAWYPDALLPYRDARLRTGFPFSIPDLYNNIPGQTNQAIWVDVFVPFERAEAPPGRYSGTLEVAWKGSTDRVSVEMEVFDFALPQDSHLPGDIWNGSMKNMPPEEEMLYYQLARQHRFLPLIYAYRPQLRVRGTAVDLDWTEFDQRLTPYLDGTAFTAKHGYWGPGEGVPLDHMMLPFDIEKGSNRANAWPVPLPEGGRTPEYEAVWRETARQVKAHLDADPRWRKVRKIAFLNGLDESYNEAAYEKMMYYGRLLHESLGRGWFQHRIDGGYSREAMEKLRAEVDLWVCHTVSWDQPMVEHFRKLGVESWFYGPMIYEQRRNSGCGSNTFLDLDLLVNRGIGWIGWKYRAGWVEWEFDWNAYASWYEAENFKEARRTYNGSGQLIYRGAVMGYRQPIPSIRLKAQRRGLQDYEYFWLLAEKTGSRDAADRLVNRVVYKQPFGPRAMLDVEIWKNDPEAWDQARAEAARLLAR
jgi:hypothetical protein